MNANENRDLIYIQRIEKHYSELLDSFQHIHNLDEFVQNNVYVKAVIFDFMQISELLNSTSDLVKEHFSKKEISGIVTTRNIAAHRYYKLKMETTYNNIKNELPLVIKTLSSLKDEIYRILIEQVLYKEVKVYIDDVKFNKNKTISYGYITNFINKEGKYQPAYVIDGRINTLYYQGQVIGYLLDDKQDTILIVTNSNKEEAIKELKDIDGIKYTELMV